MTGTVGWGKVPRSGKNVKNMEVEQRYVIEFFTDEEMRGEEIIPGLRDH
jgi:hypothetical protein